MKKLILIVLLIAISSINYSQKNETSTNIPYKEGETLKYLMYYGWIDAGYANMELKQTTFEGKDVFYAKMFAQTIGMAHKIYNVTNIYESWFNPATALPLKSKVYKEEGPKYKFKNDVLFYNAENYVISDRKGKVAVKPNTLDILSAFFYLRHMLSTELKVGQQIKLPTYFHDDPWELRITYQGTVTIKTKSGTYNCMKFMPGTEGSAFQGDKSMAIFISNDENKIPVRVQMDLWVGSINLDLIDYKGVKYPLTSKKNK